MYVHSTHDDHLLQPKKETNRKKNYIIEIDISLLPSTHTLIRSINTDTHYHQIMSSHLEHQSS